MTLSNLALFVSKEDFADAHEPLNDGVKEVPNAQTVASSSKTGDVGTDTNTQGPGRVIPEKEDTDDVTETQHDTVSESAEKGGSDKPAAPAKSDASTEEGEKDSGDGATKAPPFVKEDNAEKTESENDVPTQLEHDTAKATEDELDKTKKSTAALENYLDRAKTFDIIGYPKVQGEKLKTMVGFINRRSGNKAPVTLSFESIDGAVTIGKARIEKLTRELAVHKSKKVSTEDYDQVVETVITEAPTENGNEPLPAAVAEELTEIETDPLDVPLLEIGKVQETLKALEAGQAAIEQYRQVIVSNPRISKQAAAVLHAGLEHIDKMCGLKVRSTGLETFDTTPRAALENAEVNEKSLSNRASEIGAKILQWIKQLLVKASEIWKKYRVGLEGLRDKMVELKNTKRFPDEGEFRLAPAPEVLFANRLFVGDWVTPEEERIPGKLDKHYKELTMGITRRVKVLLTDKDPHDIAMVMEALRPEDAVFSKLPGGKEIVSEGGKLQLADREVEAPSEHTVDLSDIKPGILLEEMIKNVNKLIRLDAVSQLNKASDEVTQTLIKFRKERGKDLSESDFQAIQTAVVDNSIKLFDVDSYFEILKYLASVQNARYKLCAAIAQTKSDEE